MRLVLVTIICSVLLIGIVFVSKNTEKPELLPVEKTVSALGSTDISVEPSALENVIDEVLADAEGTYGVVVKHLGTDEAYVSNEHEQFRSASLYKLWVMKVAYDQLHNGSLSPDEVLEREVTELNGLYDIATESAEKTEGKVTYPASEALAQMITVSDNYAAYVLADRINLGNVSSFLQEYSFADSQIAQPPTTSAYDVARFYELLYDGELADPESTDAMISLLKQQQLTYKLPLYLPEDVEIAHKTGELDAVTHDAGIVFTDNGDYIIAVLSESEEPDVAADVIAEVSREVYEYFQSQ